MDEIASGILHWTAVHPKIGQEVSSYWLPGQRVLLDPITVPACRSTNENADFEPIAPSKKSRKTSAL